MELVPLHRDTKNFSLVSAVWGYKQMAIFKAESGFSPELESAAIYILKDPVSRTVRSKYLLFKLASHGVFVKRSLSYYSTWGISKEESGTS